MNILLTIQFLSAQNNTFENFFYFGERILLLKERDYLFHSQKCEFTCAYTSIKIIVYIQ